MAIIRPRVALVDATVSANLIAFNVASIDYPWIGTCSLSIEKDRRRGVSERRRWLVIEIEWMGTLKQDQGGASVGNGNEIHNRKINP